MSHVVHFGVKKTIIASISNHTFNYQQEIWQEILEISNLVPINVRKVEQCF